VSNLVIKRDVRDSAVVVAVAGDIDTATVDALVKNLDSALSVASDRSHKLLVVDLGDVTYFGSAGLNALLGCYEAGASNGVAVRLVATAAEVLRPLQVTQLDSVVRPYPTLQDAVSSLSDDGG
jgi:anti-anti-sigma factor